MEARLVARARVRAGERALDLATGTGDVALGLAAHGAVRGGLDVTHRMLQLARAKPRAAGARHLDRRRHDVAALPDGQLRGRDDRLRPAQRARPRGGRGRDRARAGARAAASLSLDFNRPESAVVRARLSGLSRARRRRRWGGPCTATPTPIATSPRRSAAIPVPRGVAGRLARAGLHGVEAVPLLGGLMTIHVAHAPV